MKPFVCLFFICTCTILNVLSYEDVLSEKIKQLTHWSSKKPVIRLNSEGFTNYVKTQPRNYSMMVMLTALSPQRQCGICKQAHDEFEIVARSYRYSNPLSNSVFFGMVDFDDASDVFQYLQLNTAPVFIHFPPEAKPKKSDHMDGSRSGFSAEHIAKWVHDRTGVQIEIYRPPNYSGFLLIALIIIMILGLLYVKRDSFKFLFNNIVWGIFVIGIVCYFISGQTWNLINGPPFMPQHKNAVINVQELTSAVTIFLSVGVILLNEAPKLKSQTGKRNSFMAIIGLATVVGLFSYILSIFRLKNQGYPYSTAQRGDGASHFVVIATISVVVDGLTLVF
ncbi:unnamed protein product, partial [Rotaria sp. Silwood1]